MQHVMLSEEAPPNPATLTPIALGRGAINGIIRILDRVWAMVRRQRIMQF